MRRTLYRLTATDLKNAAVGTTLYDGGGLHCTRTGEQALQWVHRYTSPVTGKRREPARTGLTLKVARAWADSQRELLRRGVDPLVVAEQEAAAQREALEAGNRATERKAATLLAVATAYHQSIANQFRNRKHRAQWLASLEGSLPAGLLAMPIGDIGASELLNALLPLRDRVPETARRVRQRLDAVFADAVLRNLCSGNPAAAIVRRMRVKRQGAQPHLRALHYGDVPGLVVEVRAATRIGLSVKLAIEFAILTASRSGEVRGMRWDELDRKARLWVIAPERMKGHEAHRVHLSPRALEVLSQAATLRTDIAGTALVFPAPRDGKRPLADMTLTMALRRMPTGRTLDDGEPETFADLTTMHGLARSTFSTWANSERIAAADVVEAALAHRETDRVKAAYDRSAKEGERFERDLRALRLAWSTFVCTPRKGNVVVFKRKGA